jgi:hypothetical protein
MPPADIVVPAVPAAWDEVPAEVAVPAAPPSPDIVALPADEPPLSGPVIAPLSSEPQAHAPTPKIKDIVASLKDALMPK